MLIRPMLMPTLLRIFGHRAWALPRWLDRVLPDIRFGHARPLGGLSRSWSHER